MFVREGQDLERLLKCNPNVWSKSEKVPCLFQTFKLFLIDQSPLIELLLGKYTVGFQKEMPFKNCLTLFTKYKIET